MIRAVQYWVWGVAVCCAFVGTSAMAYVPGFFDGGGQFGFTYMGEDEYSDVQKEQMRHSVSVCTERIDGGDDNPLWHLFRARYNYELFEYDLVISDCDYMLMNSPNFFPALYLRALTHSWNGEQEKSIDDFKLLLEGGYIHPRVYMHLGRAYWGIDMNNEAIETLNQVESMGGTLDAYGYWVRGAAAVDRDYPEESADALADWAKSLDVDSDFYLVYFYRGTYYYEQGEYEQALIDLTRYIGEYEEVDEAYLIRGYVLTDMYKYDRALEDFSKVIGAYQDTDELYQDAMYSRADLYFDMNRNDEGLVDVNQLIDLLGETSQNLTLRGLLYSDKGEHLKAIDDLTRSIEMETEDLAAWEWRGFSYYELLELDKALADYDYVIERYQGNDWNFSQRGLIYHDMDKYELAEKDFTQAIDMDPEYAEYYVNRAMTRFELKKYWSALQDFDKAMELEGSAPRTFATMVFVMLGTVITGILLCFAVLSFIVYSRYQKNKQSGPPALPTS